MTKIHFLILGVLFVQSRCFYTDANLKPINVEANITFFSPKGPNTIIFYSGTYANDPINQRSVLDFGDWKIYHLQYHKYHVYDIHGIKICLMTEDYPQTTELGTQYSGQVNDAFSDINAKMNFDTYIHKSTGDTRTRTFLQKAPARRKENGECPPSEEMVKIFLTLTRSPDSELPSDFYYLPSVCRSPILYHDVFCT